MISIEFLTEKISDRPKQGIFTNYYKGQSKITIDINELKMNYERILTFTISYFSDFSGLTS